MIIRIKYIITLFIACFAINFWSEAQTCCSGGVPLSGNLGLPASDAKTWQFTVNYDVNVLNTLKHETDILDDNSRKRVTHSVLMEVGYSFTKDFSVDAFFSFVRQERRIVPINQQSTFVSTNGVGDAVLLAKYRVFPFLQLGVGVKAPLGPSDLISDQGFPLIADLQPGSGAWDGILWAGFSQQITGRKTLTLSNTTTYRMTGANPTYLEVQTYEFGNEFQSITSLSDRFILKGIVLDPSLAIRYRRVESDMNNGQTMPSTGGQWVFINPGISYRINQDFSFQVNAELPIFSEVTGTQLTPTYRINTGFYLRLGRKDNLLDVPNQF